MVKVIRQGVYYLEGRIETEAHAFMTSDKKAKAVKNTISYSVLKSHGGLEEPFALRFDKVVADSMDAADVARFMDTAKIKTPQIPVTFVEGNGTAPQDYLRNAAEKFGGGYLAAVIADTSAYLCEYGAKCGEVVLSPSPAAIGAVGAFGVGGNAYEVLNSLSTFSLIGKKPEIVAVYVKGKLRKGVGTTDVALLMENALKNNFVEGKILEFFGPGVANLSMESRIAIDEAVLSFGRFASVWATDEATETYCKERGKKGFKKLVPVQPAFYDGAIVVDLTRVEPMIALGDKIRTVKEVIEGDRKNLPYDIAEKKINSSRVAGNAGGTFENIAEFAEIVRGKTLASGNYRIVPATLSVFKALADAGYLGVLSEAGAVVDAPCSYWDEEGVGCGVKSSTVRMDARSIAATLVTGTLTSALDHEYTKRLKKFVFSPNVYARLIEFKPNVEKQLLAEMKTKADPLPARLALRVGSFGEAQWDASSLEIPKGVVCGGASFDEGYDLEVLTLCREAGHYVLIVADFNDEMVKNCVTVGILPVKAGKAGLKDGDILYLDGVAKSVRNREASLTVKRYCRGKVKDVVLQLPKLTDEEREILLDGGFVGRCKRNEK